MITLWDVKFIKNKGKRPLKKMIVAVHSSSIDEARKKVKRKVDKIHPSWAFDYLLTVDSVKL